MHKLPFREHLARQYNFQRAAQNLIVLQRMSKNLPNCLIKCNLWWHYRNKSPYHNWTSKARSELNMKGKEGASSLPSSPDTDLFWEIPGGSCYLCRGRWRPRRSPRSSWPRPWLVGSRCSPSCYRPSTPTGRSEGWREERWKKKNNMNLYSEFIAYILQLYITYKYISSLILHQFCFIFGRVMKTSSHFITLFYEIFQ